MSLRIISEASARNLERGLHTGRDIGANLQDTYMSRMSKLVPGEALAAYPLFLNTIQRDPGTNARPLAAVVLVTLVVLLVVVVLRWNVTKSPEGKAQWPAVLLSAVSFIVWVGVMGGDLGFTGLAIASLVALGVPAELPSALALFAWTAIAPVLYTGDRA